MILRVSILLLMLFAPLSLSAQSASYDEVARSARVEAEITYLGTDDPVPTLERPSQDAPDATQAQETDPNVVSTPLDSQTFWVIIAVAILAALGLALATQGGSRVSVKQLGDTPRRNTINEADHISPLQEFVAAPEEVPSASYQLIQLTHQMLLHVAKLHNLRLRPSWTLRDILRQVPEDWPHHPALGALIADCERVLFGAAEISDERLATHQSALSAVNTNRSTR